MQRPWKFKHHKTFPARQATRAYQVPLQRREEKASSNWRVRSDPLASCIRVGEERGGGWNEEPSKFTNWKEQRAMLLPKRRV